MESFWKNWSDDMDFAPPNFFCASSVMDASNDFLLLPPLQGPEVSSGGARYWQMVDINNCTNNSHNAYSKARAIHRCDMPSAKLNPVESGVMGLGVVRI